MVVFDLACANAHRFELWVPSAETLDQQIAAGWVSCPHCGTVSVSRLPAAPAVHTAAQEADASPPPPSRQTREPEENLTVPLARLWRAMRQLQKEAEDVGVRFPEEARRIHYGEAPHRPIKGKAERDEVVSLLAEGILVVPLPPDKEEMH